jgi:hypothetical protein
MSKNLIVFSTLASDVAYTNHVAGGADIPIALPSVMIRGGAGVANDRLVTPRGIATPVTEEQVEYLRQNPIFKLHEKNGFVHVSEAAEAKDADKVAADMTGRDNSAPYVPQDHIAEDAQTVVGGEAVDSPPASRSKRK